MADRDQILKKKTSAESEPHSRVWTLHFTYTGMINELQVVDFDNAAKPDGRQTL